MSLKEQMNDPGPFATNYPINVPGASCAMPTMYFCWCGKQSWCQCLNEAKNQHQWLCPEHAPQWTQTRAAQFGP
jgi:hypothetical protein